MLSMFRTAAFELYLWGLLSLNSLCVLGLSLYIFFKNNTRQKQWLINKADLLLVLEPGKP